MSPLTVAKTLALLVPAAALGGAYGSQIWGGLIPCEMCYWQRWPHMAALAFALAAILFARLPDRGRSFVWLAALAILASGLIGFYHAGVEMGYFGGITQCTAGAADTLEDLMARPMIRCDEIQFSWLGISMAGWNAILSISSALVIAWLSLKQPKPPVLA